MYVSVAQRIVTVALIATAAPAFASSGTFTQKPLVLNAASIQRNIASSDNSYWISSSEYYLSDGATKAKASVGGRPVRHVLITGYHPIKGFESEVAEEAANTVRYDANSNSSRHAMTDAR